MPTTYADLHRGPFDLLTGTNVRSPETGDRRALHHFVIDDSSESATADEMAAIDAFNDDLRLHGHWVMAAGIAAPADAVIIDGRDGRSTSRDGSLCDGAEFYSGFWIVEVPDIDQARRLAVEGSRACNRRLELRPLL